MRIYIGWQIILECVNYTRTFVKIIDKQYQTLTL